MKSSYWRKVRTFLFIFVVIYIVAGILLYFFQDLLLFHPVPKTKDYQYQFSHDFKELNIPVGDRNLNIIRFRPGGAIKGVVIFFHGNMKNVEHYKKYPEFFISENYEVWMPDYPGFGKSTGERTEENIYSDARLVYDSAIKTSNNIIIYGKSIGTGVASYLASIKPCQRLVLETPYYNIDALAESFVPFYPVAAMSRYSFPVNQYLHSTEAPVTIFHGTNDEVVPFSHSLRLLKENDHAELVRIEKGRHNNLASFPIFVSKLDSLLNLPFFQGN